MPPANMYIVFSDLRITVGRDKQVEGPRALPTLNRCGLQIPPTRFPALLLL